MEELYLELMRIASPIGEPLTPEKRARDFIAELQGTPNGEEITVRGFLLLRKPPNAPKDAAYYLLSALSPSELRKLPSSAPRPYIVVRIGPETSIGGKFLSGSYVEVRGILEPYPWGNLRMIRALSLRSADYSDYWKDYREMALGPNEVEELIESSIYTNREFQLGLIYALYGSPPVLESPRGWSEGYELSILGQRGREGSLLTLWRILRFLYTSLPEELRFRKGKRSVFTDGFLDLDFKIFDPNGTPVRYYVPRTPGKVSRYAERMILAKKLAGMLALPKRASPTDGLSSRAETPFVFIPEEDERPYLENESMLRDYLPNLIVTIFVERERIKSLSTSGKLGETFQRKFEDWLMEKRNEYGWAFDVLTIPGGVFDVGIRYELSLRLLGSMARLDGKVRRSHLGRVKTLNDEILNDWMAVLSSMPQSELQRLLKLYRGYMPGDHRAAKALQLFRNLASTTFTGEVARETFRAELIRAGFSEEAAERIIETLVREGYLYEPSAGVLKLVR
ncbi:hypothetical protein [Thermococcus sp. AM4]|uniref:hypothetical protein n=1 Tax=Thermococcus sp. (strain AM4) TaxID=246969 RepID=UPI000187132B|nr:hypothetical protein [Thermococcus sp. AM4]EEB74277.1 conserved hypothetical protein [Thermococcus sp. AM4]